MPLKTSTIHSIAALRHDETKPIGDLTSQISRIVRTEPFGDVLEGFLDDKLGRTNQTKMEVPSIALAPDFADGLEATPAAGTSMKQLSGSGINPSWS